MNNFKTSLKIDDNDLIYNNLIKQHELLTKSPKYVEFSKNILLELGNEVKTNFSKITFELRLRFKSDNSAKNKAQKKQEQFWATGDELKSKIYDDIGYKIVVTNVPDDYISENAKLTEDLLKRKNTKKSLEKYKKEYKKLVKLQSNNLDNSFIDIAKKAMENTIKTQTEYYNDLNDSCQREVAKEIMNYLVTQSTIFSTKYGITDIQNRRKHHNKDNGYIAEHSTIISSFLPDWCAEIQTKSEYRDLLAKTGTAAHAKRAGKKRLIPKKAIISNNTELIKSYLPKYMLYILNTNEVYECSDLENFCYYYNDDLIGNEETLNKIISSGIFSKDGSIRDIS